jgi:hypothetical protein
MLSFPLFHDVRLVTFINDIFVPCMIIREINTGPHSVGVGSELFLLALPAVVGQAIDPMAQLMETAYIGRLGIFFVLLYRISVTELNHVFIA